MKYGGTKGFLIAFPVCLSLLLILVTAIDSSAADSLLAEQDLDDLLAPIALYQDPLLAQMLPASTYPEELVDVAEWLRTGGDPSALEEQNWDENVLAIANYPDVLYMMADNIDWTASVGDAFLNQPDDVTDSIQRLRWQAQKLGNLVSNDQQTVVIDGDYIEILPAQPQYIYVPQYNPAVVYAENSTPYIPPFITFGSGFMIGSWLDLDFDWGRHHLFYHGWNRPGWVNKARPYVHIKNVYVQNSRPYIDQKWTHDPSHGDPGRYWASKPGGRPDGKYPHPLEARGREQTPTRSTDSVLIPRTNTRLYSNRGKQSLRAAIASPKPASQSPPVVLHLPTAPETPTEPREPTVHRMPTVPQPIVPRMPTVSQAPTVFGGYRGADEVRTLSMRGQESRQSSAGGYTPSAPVNRSGFSGGHGAPGGGGGGGHGGGGGRR